MISMIPIFILQINNFFIYLFIGPFPQLGVCSMFMFLFIGSWWCIKSQNIRTYYKIYVLKITTIYIFYVQYFLFQNIISICDTCLTPFLEYSKNVPTISLQDLYSFEGYSISKVITFQDKLVSPYPKFISYKLVLVWG